MSQENHEARIAELENKVRAINESNKFSSMAVKQLTDVVSSLNLKLHQEINGRLEMSLTILGVVIRLKNQHNRLARVVAGSVLINGGKEILDEVAQLETECERLEHIIQKAIMNQPEQPSEAG